MNPRTLTDKRGNLRPQPDDTEIARIENQIRRLMQAVAIIPAVFASINDELEDALTTPAPAPPKPCPRDDCENLRPCPNHDEPAGATISDPTGNQAARIARPQAKLRAMRRAIRGVDEAIEHMSLTAERCLSKHIANPADISSAQRCPVMVLRTDDVPGVTGQARNEVMIRCDRLTAHKRGDNGEAIDYDPDGYCNEHRAEADRAARVAEHSNARRLRRHKESA